jgi:RNA polymerase sigma-70 factor (ECF subfamily)
MKLAAVIHAEEFDVSQIWKKAPSWHINMGSDSIGLSDAKTVRQVIDGDVDAFEHLLNKYQDHVLRIVKKHVPHREVEEMAQDIFVRAYQALPGFKEEGSFRQWLSAIAVRTCYDFWRKRYRSRELPMSDLSEKHRDWLERTLSNESNQSFHEKSMENEAREVLDWALSKLSAKDRMVLELVYLEGLSGKEAAGLLGWSVANVKVRSFRSRKKLETLLKGVISP